MCVCVCDMTLVATLWVHNPDDTKSSDGAKGTLADLPITTTSVTTATPTVESQSATSTEVSVVANVNHIAFSVVCTETKLKRSHRNVVIDACPTPAYFARRKTQDGSLFSEILVHTREAFV